ncbi:peptide-methionine (S)-S-oxide reductase [Neomicrococcus aestuarii]|uniref:Peptide methionine sulfoxide reductase MsrA n=1 Tax=Neomicrococcus aestuarii TaxID=556325 RepID=A0A7W8TSR5_9MICC|nr:peptide-methionine (S)-S-oxide reductase MsrA [Neomicrococcus aestuarii]MBB5512093.1 peptide-methionine (S)-S-oxide reductase [Neomicrococcus aestuarii]
MATEEETKTPELETYLLAGGCFWCLDALYRKVRGVTEVVSGYTGGHFDNPDYRAVCTGTTGHAEAVAVQFDPGVVPRDVILDMFFTMHNPTTLNRQGYDVGTQYRSAMFPLDDVQKADFERAIARTQELWSDPIVTTIEAVAPFYVAESVHQDFYAKQPGQGYCQVIIDPKLAKARQQFAPWIQERVVTS